MQSLLSRVSLVALIACLAAAPPWRPTTQDIVALKHLALEHGAPVHYIAKSPSEMPPFDPIVYYAGDTDPGWIWENRGDESSSGHTRALRHALILAAMDSGAAGDTWKHYYDLLAARDKTQSSGTADKYFYRHAFLQHLDQALAKLAPRFSARTVDPTLQSAASSITQETLTAVIRGIFRTPIAAKTAALPDGMLARYDGQLGLGNYVIELSSRAADYEFYMDQDPPGSTDAQLGAYFQAVIDSGAAGAALKDSYDRASDKARFGLTIAVAFRLESERTEAQSRANIAWMQASIHAGMARQAVEALLSAHKITLRYDKRDGFVEFPIRSTISCGTSITVVVRFDSQQNVSEVAVQPPYTACL